MPGNSPYHAAALAPQDFVKGNILTKYEEEKVRNCSIV